MYFDKVKDIVCNDSDYMTAYKLHDLVSVGKDTIKAQFKGTCGFF